jgi:hypothetical protein
MCSFKGLIFVEGYMVQGINPWVKSFNVTTREALAKVENALFGSDFSSHPGNIKMEHVLLI